MLAVEHRKGAQNEVRYAVFPAVTGAPGIQQCCRRFLQAHQEPFDDPLSYADSITPFLNSELLRGISDFTFTKFMIKKRHETENSTVQLSLCGEMGNLAEGSRHGSGGFLLEGRGGNVTYEFADTTRISFVFRKKGRILQRIPFGHFSSKAGVIFCSLLFLVPRAAKSKIAGEALRALDIPV
jgi:hypothetical protein